jgi:uncharacterized protein (UPF0147 family)
MRDDIKDQLEQRRGRDDMPKMTINVVSTELEKVKKVFGILNDVTKDERVPLRVREEVMDKVNSILESTNTVD